MGNNCIPPCSIIHLGFGAYLHSISVRLPPSSLSRNSCTFPKVLVTGSHPARPCRVRFSDANPVPPHDGPARVFPYLLSCCMRPEGPWQQLAASLMNSSRFSTPPTLPNPVPNCSGSYWGALISYSLKTARQRKGINRKEGKEARVGEAKERTA